jgi:glycosyltransferase involved in cell wall biosynthesis
VVAAEIGMLPEIVADGVSGLVVEPTEDAIEAALSRLCSDPDLRKRLGEGARHAAVERFDMDRQAGTVERFYESLVAGRGR